MPSTAVRESLAIRITIRIPFLIGQILLRIGPVQFGGVYNRHPPRFTCLTRILVSLGRSVKRKDARRTALNVVLNVVVGECLSPC
jgi:hypothetical protein